MGRTRSHNVEFRGLSKDDDPYEPPGHELAIRLRDHLRSEGYAAADEDNWRDCGWSIDITLPQVVLQLALASLPEVGTWLAQIAPLNEPGLVAQLFGRKFVSHDAEVLDISRCIHRWLIQAGYNSVVWRVDGYPDSATGLPEPAVPNNGHS